MLPSPPVDLSHLPAFADWVELCALLRRSEPLSTTDVADLLHDAGVLGGRPEDLFPGDREDVDAATFSEHDEVERFVQEVWQVLLDRRVNLSEVYPFQVDPLQLVNDNDCADLCYRILLVADIWKSSDLGSIANEPFPRLFEKIVEGSQRGLLKGSVVRFGVPREPEWPAAIEERIGRLADGLGVETESLEGKVAATEGDRGLDVAGRLGFLDDGPGSLIFLTQCATGLHWQGKSGEPSIENWHDILRWDGKLVRVVAVPWHLEPKEKIRTYRRFEAVVLDRFRLLSGRPDSFLDATVKEELEEWWKAQAAILSQR